MLVLSRKKGDSIVINDNISVTVIEIRGEQVRLGVEAPPKKCRFIGERCLMRFSGLH